jgi:hypothetical protein
MNKPEPLTREGRCNACGTLIVEGRKVSAEALNWLKHLRDISVRRAANFGGARWEKEEAEQRHRTELIDELLCVLSEQQKEGQGGTEITSASKSSETSKL